MSARTLFSEVSYVLLDRDGVINRKAPEGSYIGRWGDFELLPGADTAIAALNRSGRRVLVVSNQRGIARGLYSRSDVDETHDRLQDLLAGCGARIDAFYYCPHDLNECDCRKPRTGLFQSALLDFPDLAMLKGAVIGDSPSDIEFARSLGFPSIFIRSDEATRSPGSDRAEKLADAVSSSLADAVAEYF